MTLLLVLAILQSPIAYGVAHCEIVRKALSPRAASRTALPY